MKLKGSGKKLNEIDVLDAAGDLYNMGEKVSTINIFHELRRRGKVTQSDWNELIGTSIQKKGKIRKILEKRGWRFEMRK